MIRVIMNTYTLLLKHKMDDLFGSDDSDQEQPEQTTNNQDEDMNGFISDNAIINTSNQANVTVDHTDLPSLSFPQTKEAEVNILKIDLI